jgi:hypothetical protein
LRSVRTGDVGDRWEIDVAVPLPVTAGGNRYVIAAVEYTTRYAVAAAVPEHTAKSIARFRMDKVVLVYGPMREVMMDGAREFGSKATDDSSGSDDGTSAPANEAGALGQRPAAVQTDEQRLAAARQGVTTAA